MVMDLTQAGREIHAAHSRDHRRHIRRARKRPRRAARVHRQQGAQRPRRAHRSGEPGAGRTGRRHAPRSPTRIDSVHVAAGRSSSTYMKDVASKAYVHNLEGTLENEIALPGLGSASGFGGNMDDKFIFYTYTSFTYPSIASSATTSRRGRARCSARRRFPDSTPISTRPSRSSSPARTARRCRCS